MDVFDVQEQPTAKAPAKKKTKKRKQSAGTSITTPVTAESSLVTEAKRAKLLPEEEPEDAMAEEPAGSLLPPGTSTQVPVDPVSP